MNRFFCIPFEGKTNFLSVQKPQESRFCNYTAVAPGLLISKIPSSCSTSSDDVWISVRGGVITTATAAREACLTFPDLLAFGGNLILVNIWISLGEKNGFVSLSENKTTPLRLLCLLFLLAFKSPEVNFKVTIKGGDKGASSEWSEWHTKWLWISPEAHAKAPLVRKPERLWVAAPPGPVTKLTPSSASKTHSHLNKFRWALVCTLSSSALRAVARVWPWISSRTASSQTSLSLNFSAPPGKPMCS